MDKFVDSLKKSFSVVASGTKKITKNVAGKTGNLVDITKLNIALKDTDKKITEIYKIIGKTVYQKYSEGMPVTDTFSDLCEEIDAFVIEQESLKAQIAELKGPASQPECKYSVPSEKSNKPKNHVIEITDSEDDE